MIDLHTHSSASDGTLSPAALLEYAAQLGVSVLALTDHDTISGIPEAEAAAKKFGVSLIPGVEFNIEVPFGEFHLLAYGTDMKNASFLQLLDEAKYNRNERNQNLCDQLFAHGIAITYQNLQEKFSGQIGRPHIARTLKELGIVKSVQEGFDKYLAKGRPFYLKTKGLDFEKALRTIKKANGVAVLAHPMSLYLSWGKLEGKIRELKEAGLDALEAWNTGTKAHYCRRLEKLAEQLKMPVTAGSDFHGKNKPDHRLGMRSDGKKIDERYYEENLKVLLERSKAVHTIR